MQIAILNVTITTHPTKTGSYQKADVAFKNLTYGGKVEGKVVTSFGAQEASFKVLATAQPTDVYDVTVVKNDKGYNDWTNMTKGTAGSDTAPPAQGRSTAGSPNAPAPARNSSFETPEERAKRQVFIIRQSSISSAVAALSVGVKAPPNVEDVIKYAQHLAAFVVSDEPTFDDVPDFPPEAE